jgi:uncharacterized protein YkwD
MKQVKRTVLRAFVVLATLLLFCGCDLLSGLLSGGPGNDPVVIPDSVAADGTYTSLENDFIAAVNKVRTDNTVAALTRESTIDALARRYSSAGKIDTVPANLKNRIKTAYGGCSDAAFFQFSSSGTPSVTTAMNSWLGQTGGTTTMRGATFTKVGIGIVSGPAPAGSPGTWIWVTILLAKP